MRENYSEKLPKTMRFKTTELRSTSSNAYRAASLLGIPELLRSEELRSLAERVTATSLVPNPGCQIICYESGDFVGPHNDHHPEELHLRHGYVDAHIMLPEPGVKSQMLVYEKQPGLLNASEEVGNHPAIAFYRLPFWHYVTPLIAKHGARRARRWLLLASYEMNRH
jgi:hypothetical protein